ncbi:hypothetical protein QAD02_024136 [Eretmocerus hayati]|uniref:Uncharacterized protein n=1 Tax=Eretmocerus hayati TaxID=131215 RepID=A0ACC2PXS7_9HYME|nr:hypothetical protein QAD02_024136 [Eretmocerus hayati]
MNVVDELHKIFLIFGAPYIPQNDKGKEFAAEVIEGLVSRWPQCKIINGRPRHLQPQGCYGIQWKKTTPLHQIINRTPYESVLGPIKFGLSSTNLPREVNASFNTEEDSESALTNQNNGVADQHPRSDLLEAGMNAVSLDDVKLGTLLTLRETASK